MSKRIYATTTPGFEPALEAEISRIGGRNLTQTTGGIEFSTDLEKLPLLPRQSRCANRILLRLDEFDAHRFDELKEETGKLPWQNYLTGDDTLRIKAHSKRSRLYHTGAIEERIFEAIEASLGADSPTHSASSSDADQFILARMDRNHCQLSIAVNTRLLHQRCWRKHSGPAPIRETIAAAVLEQSNWDPDLPLIDPLCGSGTIPIEAARKATDRPPTTREDFSVDSWPLFRDNTHSVLEATSRRIPQIGGRDISSQAIEAARNNTNRAEVADIVRLEVGEVSNLEPIFESEGYIISNPPYGNRLDVGHHPPHEKLIEQFGNLFDGWRLLLILPSKMIPTHAKLMFEELISFQNGGIDVKLWKGTHF